MVPKQDLYKDINDNMKRKFHKTFATVGEEQYIVFGC